MRRILCVASLVLIAASHQASAQVRSLNREGIVPTVRQSSNAEPAPNTPEWQLTLDVIKVKAGVLMDKNNQLNDQHDAIIESYKNVQEQIRDVQMKNEELRQILKERRGRNEQQVEIDALNVQIKAKEAALKGLQRDLAQVQSDAAAAEKKIQLKKLKVADMEISAKTAKMHTTVKEAIDQRAAMGMDDELRQINEKVQIERDQEELLKTQLNELKQNPQAVLSNEVVTPEELTALQQKVQALRAEKEDLQKQANVDNSQVKTQRYLTLMAKKMELEAKIKESEAQLEQLKQPEALGIWDPKQKKQLVRQLAQIDTRNGQVRQKISGLHENVTLLREQISRLERKVSRKRGMSDQSGEK